MFKRMVLILFAMTWCGSWAGATELQVEEARITTAIVDQMPIDSISSYPADYGKLFCFTRIIGAQEETEVTHVWLYQGDELARVTLPVRSSNWRTYSSKRFLPQWAGQWRVLILDAEEQKLTEVAFTLE